MSWCVLKHLHGSVQTFTYGGACHPVPMRLLNVSQPPVLTVFASGARAMARFLLFNPGRRHGVNKSILWLKIESLAASRGRKRAATAQARSRMRATRSSLVAWRLALARITLTKGGRALCTATRCARRPRMLIDGRISACLHHDADSNEGTQMTATMQPAALAHARAAHRDAAPPLRPHLPTSTARQSHRPGTAAYNAVRDVC